MCVPSTLYNARHFLQTRVTLYVARLCWRSARNNNTKTKWPWSECLQKRSLCALLEYLDLKLYDIPEFRTCPEAPRRLFKWKKRGKCYKILLVSALISPNIHHLTSPQLNSAWSLQPLGFSSFYIPKDAADSTVL